VVFFFLGGSEAGYWSHFRSKSSKSKFLPRLDEEKQCLFPCSNFQCSQTNWMFLDGCGLLRLLNIILIFNIVSHLESSRCEVSYREVVEIANFMMCAFSIAPGWWCSLSPSKWTSHVMTCYDLSSQANYGKNFHETVIKF